MAPLFCILLIPVRSLNLQSKAVLKLVKCCKMVDVIMSLPCKTLDYLTQCYRNHQMACKTL